MNTQQNECGFGAGCCYQASRIETLEALNQELVEALKGMVQLDEEEHQRGPGDIDICKEVQDAYAALAKASGSATQTGEKE